MTGTAWALLAVAGLAGVLCVLQLLVNGDVLESRSFGKKDAELYRGVHANHGFPPPRERISWLGGDTTSGHWIWQQPPDERLARREHL